MTWPGDYAALGVIITSLLAVVTAVLTGFWKFVILPQIRLEVVQPVRETHKQVTENGGQNDPPTVPDKLHALQTSVDDLHVMVGQLVEADERQVEADKKQTKQTDLLGQVLLDHLRDHKPDLGGPKA